MVLPWPHVISAYTCTDQHSAKSSRDFYSPTKFSLPGSLLSGTPSCEFELSFFPVSQFHLFNLGGISKLFLNSAALIHTLKFSSGNSYSDRKLALFISCFSGINDFCCLQVNILRTVSIFHTVF